MREGGDDVEGLAGFFGLFFWGEEPHGAHVVQPVGYFDDEHSWVLGHGHDHFSDGFRFRRRP